MARPPVFPAEEKVRIVLSILAGEITLAEAARRAKVSEQGRDWKRQFLEAGKTGLTAGKSGPSTREQQLEAEVVEPVEGGVVDPRPVLESEVQEQLRRRSVPTAEAHQPRSRHSGSCGRSVPRVVSSPWPG